MTFQANSSGQWSQLQAAKGERCKCVSKLFAWPARTNRRPSDLPEEREQRRRSARAACDQLSATIARPTSIASLSAGGKWRPPSPLSISAKKERNRLLSIHSRLHIQISLSPILIQFSGFSRLSCCWPTRVQIQSQAAPTAALLECNKCSSGPRFMAAFISC